MNGIGKRFSSFLRQIIKRPAAVIDEPDLVRKHQLKKMGAVFLALAGTAVLLTFAFKMITGGREEKKDIQNPRVKLLQDKIPMEIKQAQDLGQVKYLEDKNKALRDDNLKLREQLSSKSEEFLKKDLKSLNKPDRKPGLIIPPEPPSGFAVTSPVPRFKTPESGREENSVAAMPRLPFAPVDKGSFQNLSNPAAKSTHAAPGFTSGIRVFGESAGTGKDPRKKKGELGKKVWIPGGSFAAGQLLSGLDAPTGGYSQANPHPVLIRLIDPAILPGRQRMDIKECFVIGAGYGDMASERAYIRTESLSCVKKDRTTVDLPLKGYVVGEDGKVGLRGRLVSKQGQMLARALVAGLASGMSDAFKPVAPTYYATTEGTKDGRMVFPNPQDVLQAGAMGGMSKALDRLSHFYIDMAKQVFPIIEVDAGRRVEVVVLKGLEIIEDKVAGD